MKVQEVKTDKSDKELKSHLFQKGEDPRRNLAGRPEGTLNFATKWRKFIEKVAETNEVTPEELESQLLAVGFKEAKAGQFNFWKDIHDRVYGKPKETIEHQGEINKLDDEQVRRIIIRESKRISSEQDSPETSN
jgi:hypothetical protein